MSTDSFESPRLRASDAEREEYAQIVREAVGEGRLTLDEGDERLAAIYATKFRGDLDPIIGDLPAAVKESVAVRSPGGPAFRRPPHGRHPGRRGREAIDSGREFARHVAFLLFIAAVLTGIWAITGAHFFWPAIPLTLLTLKLFAHARAAAWSRHR